MKKLEGLNKCVNFFFRCAVLFWILHPVIGGSGTGQ